MITWRWSSTNHVVLWAICSRPLSTAVEKDSKNTRQKRKYSYPKKKQQQMTPPGYTNHNASEERKSKYQTPAPTKRGARIKPTDNNFICISNATRNSGPPKKSRSAGCV